MKGSVPCCLPQRQAARDSLTPAPQRAAEAGRAENAGRQAALCASAGRRGLRSAACHRFGRAAPGTGTAYPAHCELFPPPSCGHQPRPAPLGPARPVGLRPTANLHQLQLGQAPSWALQHRGAQRKAGPAQTCQAVAPGAARLPLQPPLTQTLLPQAWTEAAAPAARELAPGCFWTFDGVFRAACRGQGKRPAGSLGELRGSPHHSSPDTALASRHAAALPAAGSSSHPQNQRSSSIQEQNTFLT